ncbi:hydroxysteroid 11-beta-dehydrogenase 1-like protein isoform X2 [Asterias amurensis]|uniref:hydroxysteroid 11-beta-dehydrogenase 1-like protein isoform X2 n=1 Tax=Asterias amurensis TaxID=7602 RepID=UPI003AB65A18
MLQHLACCWWVGVIGVTYVQLCVCNCSGFWNLEEVQVMGLTKYVVLILACYIGFQLFDRFDPGSIKGKRVVITGASTGIGEQIAYQYAKLGAKILITARRESALQEVVAKCKELGAQEALYLPLDMGKQEDTVRLIDEAKIRFGGLDHLILNHITNNYMRLWTGDMDLLKQTMDINFHAYVSLATQSLPMLSESHGSIAVLSSFAGKVGVPFVACYSASKFALHGFFDALRQELQLQNANLSISTFVIGSIDTPNAKEFSKDVMDNNFFYTTASSTAYRIMTGTSNREREVFYPWYQTRPMLLLRDVAPPLVELAMKLTVKQEIIEKVLKEPQFF